MDSPLSQRLVHYNQAGDSAAYYRADRAIFKRAVVTRAPANPRAIIETNDRPRGGDQAYRYRPLREQIPVITLAPELQQFAELKKVPLHGFGSNLGNGHWNETGHRVAGELLARKVCEGGFLK